MNWIDFFSIWVFIIVLSISVLFGFVELVFIDIFSIWLLGHPWGTACEPDLSFEKADYLSTWIGSTCCEWTSLLFGFGEMILIDFFSMWILRNCLNVFLFAFGSLKCS